MTRPLTAAQRRLIEAADPETGRLKGTEAQLTALVKRGLAFRHPRPPHDHFLTPDGHRAREARSEPQENEPQTPASAGGVFTARVGGEPAPPAEGPSRAREVRSAWQGMLELRRMTNPDASTDRPCAWERTHLVQAAALALEAAGHRPAGVTDGEDGYRVRDTPQPDAVAVYAPDATLLRACAETLEGAGWQAGEYTEPRTRRRYVLASPRRV
ncbi:hypothetical protein OIE82_06680 [Streptomyces althioticus]|jgi:hypothetical protein|uniref:Uncharacterized protein n=1 Tax=Streptomyces althioticus TaxID=83380 RepID=A0ABZ1Y0N8_9ACTN|nr:hypothetical protein OG968_06585 [Streptomyces althioticus]GGQ92993.1 hypothetical protein GCM10010267_64870 [Streptomyces griseorubens]